MTVVKIMITRRVARIIPKTTKNFSSLVNAKHPNHNQTNNFDVCLDRRQGRKDTLVKQAFDQSTLNLLCN